MHQCIAEQIGPVARCHLLCYFWKWAKVWPQPFHQFSIHQSKSIQSPYWILYLSINIKGEGQERRKKWRIFPFAQIFSFLAYKNFGRSWFQICIWIFDIFHRSKVTARPSWQKGVKSTKIGIFCLLWHTVTFQPGQT